MTLKPFFSDACVHGCAKYEETTGALLASLQEQIPESSRTMAMTTPWKNVAILRETVCGAVDRTMPVVPRSTRHFIKQ